MNFLQEMVASGHLITVDSTENVALLRQRFQSDGYLLLNGLLKTWKVSADRIQTLCIELQYLTLCLHRKSAETAIINVLQNLLAAIQI